VYNLATAAAAAGINKSTVLRHIKAGKVSATRDHNGGWQIDPAEFHRIFPPLVTAGAEQPPKQQDTTAALSTFDLGTDLGAKASVRSNLFFNNRVLLIIHIKFFYEY